MAQKDQTTITLTKAAKEELDEDRQDGLSWEGYLLGLKRESGGEDLKRLEEKIDQLDERVASTVVDELGQNRY